MKYIEEVIYYIKVIKTDLFDIVKAFQSGHDNAATVQVATVTQKMLSLLNKINSGILKDILDIDYNKLNSILINISKALQIENYILIDDLLEYELTFMLDDWLSQIDCYIKSQGADL